MNRACENRSAPSKESAQKNQNPRKFPRSFIFPAFCANTTQMQMKLIDYRDGTENERTSGSRPAKK